MQQKEDEVIHPEPAMSIKDCKKFQRTQRFDVTALLDEVSDIRSVTDNRQLVSVKILDDSGDDGKPAELSFSYFMDLPLSTKDAAMIDILRSANTESTKQAYSFFALQGRKNEKGYTIEADSKSDFFFVQAAGPKAIRLAEKAASLQETRDYTKEPGSQNLEEQQTLWQLNSVEVAWPTGDTLLKKDLTALWFLTSFRDMTGQ